jgi:hypothetical protein
MYVPAYLVFLEQLCHDSSIFFKGRLKLLSRNEISLSPMHSLRMLTKIKSSKLCSVATIRVLTALLHVASAEKLLIAVLDRVHEGYQRFLFD